MDKKNATSSYQDSIEFRKWDQYQFYFFLILLSTTYTTTTLTISITIITNHTITTIYNELMQLNQL